MVRWSLGQKLIRASVVAVLLLTSLMSAIVFEPLLNIEEHTVYAGGGSGTIGTVRVSASVADSSMTDPTEGYDNTLTYGIIGKSGAGNAMNAAMIFSGINIPANCTILSAYITFTASATKSDNVSSVTIKGEDTATPATYGATEDFTSRTETTASVSWAITSSWTAESTYNSPSILSIVQELYASYAPYASGTMAFEIDGFTGSAAWLVKKFYSYDGSSTKAPLLVITYAPNDCYWVGGTGSWADATTHWAISSGGAADANYLPADFTNVHFDANSDTGGVFTVHAASAGYCHDMDWTGVDKVPTFDAVSGPYSLLISGSVILSANLLFDSDDGFHIIFTGSGSETITTNGATFGLEYPYYLKFDGTGDYTLQDNLTTGLSLYFNRGTLNLNDKNVTCAQFEISSTNVRNIDLTSSVITITGTSAKWDAGTTTNLTFDAGTSDIYLTGANNEFNGGGLTYWNAYLNGSGNQTVKGANTFHELGRTGTAVKTDILTLYANQVVGSGAGVLTLNGNSATNRLLVQSDTPATYRTLTVNGTISATNVDFLDIQGAGTASWDLSAITGGSGNVGHNSGITFTTAADRFWIDNSGSWSDTTHWSTTSGGGSGASVPLCQDTAIFDANSITIDSRVINMDMPRIGNIDCEDVENEPQFDGDGAGGGTVNLYGDIVLGDVNFTPVTTNFYGRGTQEVWSNGEQFDCTSVYLYNYGAVWHIEDDFLTTGILYLRAGTLNMQGLDLIADKFDTSTTTYTRSLSMNGGTLEVVGTGTCWNVNSTNFTLGANTGVIIVHGDNATARTFTSGGLTTYNYILIEGSGAYTLTVTAMTCNILYIDRSEAAKTISGAVTITMNTGMAIPIESTTVVTITNTDFTCANDFCSDYLTISGSTAAGGGSFYAGTHSTNSGGNAGWTWSACTAPTLDTNNADNLSLTSARLHGDVDAMGTFTTLYVFFQYTLDADFSDPDHTLETAEQTCIGAGAFQADVTGLSSDEVYTYRIAARYNIGSYSYGDNVTFNTSGAPVVQTDDVSVYSTNYAVLRGTLLSFGIYDTVDVWFEYGLTAAYGSETAKDTTEVLGTFSSLINGLTLDTTYHYMAHATYIKDGVSYDVDGVDKTFTTLRTTGATGVVQVLGGAVFSHYIDIGDLLITAEVINTYPPYYKVTNPTESFVVQLLDPTGTTVIAVSPLKQWDESPVGIYLNTNSASHISYGGAYIIRMIGTFSTPPSDTYTLQPNDWKGSNQTLLDSWLISTAEDMNVYYETTASNSLTTNEIGGSQIISTTGGRYFATGIANIMSVRPDMFETTKNIPDSPSGDATNALDSSKSWQQQVGATIAGDAAVFGTVLGTSAKQFLSLGIWIFYLFAILFTFASSKGSESVFVMILCIPVLFIGWHFRLIEYYIIGVMAAVAVLLFLIKLWGTK